MNLRPFLKKQDNKLPDSYEITVTYHDGPKDTFNIAQHRLLPSQVLEFVTTEDEWFIIPLTSIKKLAFDKNLSRIVALKQEKI